MSFVMPLKPCYSPPPSEHAGRKAVYPILGVKSASNLALCVPFLENADSSPIATIPTGESAAEGTSSSTKRD